MKELLAGTCLLAVLGVGCATKKYVRNTTAPVQAKVDQVGEQTNRNSQSIEDTNGQVKDVDERAQRGISAAQERAATADQHAATADQHATEAHNRADQAAQSADQANAGLDKLRTVVANIDDYQLQNSATIPFKVNQYRLSNEAKQQLDELAAQTKADKRFYIAVEGYTDRTGSKEYNETLSRRRADTVVEYLVTKYDIPITRIQMIGLAEQKPVDEGRNRAALAKNRRVEVKLFSADQVTASLEPNQSDRNSASRSDTTPSAAGRSDTTPNQPNQ